METEALIVLSTFPSEEQARQIGAVLVERQAAACVNLISGLTSIYRWKGKLQQDTEVLAIIKTTRDALVRLEELIDELHPYEVPEFIALPVENGSLSYLNWLSTQVE